MHSIIIKIIVILNRVILDKKLQKKVLDIDYHKAFVR